MYQDIKSALQRKNYETTLKIPLSDKYATFILTGGNDEKNYTPAQKLFSIALKYKSENQIVYTKKLDDAINFILQNNSDSINFIVGSFYIYESVISKIN